MSNYDYDYYDEENFQRYAFDRTLGTSPNTHVANGISTAWETTPSREGIFLKDFFEKRFRNMRRLIGN